MVFEIKIALAERVFEIKVKESNIMTDVTTFKRYLCIKSLYDLDGNLLLEEGKIYWLSDEKLDKAIILALEKGEIEEYPNFDDAFNNRFKPIT